LFLLDQQLRNDIREVPENAHHPLTQSRSPRRGVVSERTRGWVLARVALVTVDLTAVRPAVHTVVGGAEIEDPGVLGDRRVVAPLDVVVQQERPVADGLAILDARDEFVDAVDGVDWWPDTLWDDRRW
jgi:hypothetical protein